MFVRKSKQKKCHICCYKCLVFQGMTFLGDASLGDPPPIDASGDRHTVMNTLRRRPQSILGIYCTIAYFWNVFVC